MSESKYFCIVHNKYIFCALYRKKNKLIIKTKEEKNDKRRTGKTNGVNKIIIFNMELQLVNFKQAQSLKELGFPQGWECENHYCLESEGDYGYQIGDTISANAAYKNALDAISAPSIELVAKWLREEKQLFIHVDYDFHNNEKPYKCEVCKFNGMTCHVGWFKDYDEALSSATDKALEILKRK